MRNKVCGTISELCWSTILNICIEVIMNQKFRIYHTVYLVFIIERYGSYHTEYMSSYSKGIYASYCRGICEYLSYGDMGSYNTIRIPLL